MLLRETLDQVIAADVVGLWDQESWFRETECGTAGCFAGWRFMLDGGEKASRQPGIGGGFGRLPRVLPLISVPDWARARLGLTDEEADELFSPMNKLSELKRIVDDLCDGRKE